MTQISNTALRTVLDAITSGGTWRQCMAQVGAAENTAFVWMARSREAEKADDQSSVFYVDWPEGSEPAYWHKLIFRARARRAMVLEAQMVSEAIHGHTEVVIADGKICWAENPLWIGVSDDEMREVFGADPVRDRILRDKDGMPVPLTRKVPMAATSRNMLLQGAMPGVYGAHVSVDVKSRNVVHVVGHRKPLPDMTGRGIDELRRLAATPPKHPRPTHQVQTFSPDDSAPDRVGAFPAEEPPPRPQPSYARPPRPSSDDVHSAEHARRGEALDRSRGDNVGRGAPPTGGFRVR